MVLGTLETSRYKLYYSTILSNHFVCLAPPLISVDGVSIGGEIKVLIKIVSVCLSQVGSLERECVCL